MAKKKAREEGETGKKVYFISLVAANRCGKPDNRRHVYDIISGDYDLKDTGDATSPIFIDVPQLIEYHDKNQGLGAKALGIFKANTVYDLATFFVANNPEAHFVLDEVPILAYQSIGDNVNKGNFFGCLLSLVLLIAALV